MVELVHPSHGIYRMCWYVAHSDFEGVKILTNIKALVSDPSRIEGSSEGKAFDISKVRIFSSD